MERSHRICILLIGLLAAVLLLVVTMTTAELDRLDNRPRIVQQDVYIDGVPIPTAPPREPLGA